MIASEWHMNAHVILYEYVYNNIIYYAYIIIPCNIRGKLDDKTINLGADASLQHQYDLFVVREEIATIQDAIAGQGPIRKNLYPFIILPNVTYFQSCCSGHMTTT